MLRISILSPSQNIFEGEGTSVYIKTLSGDAEIFQKHADFISIIVGEVRIKAQGGEEKKIDLGTKKAIFYTNGKIVKIFVL